MSEQPRSDAVGVWMPEELAADSPLNRMVRIIQAALREDGYPTVEVSSRGCQVLIEDGVVVDDAFVAALHRAWKLANRRVLPDEDFALLYAYFERLEAR